MKLTLISGLLLGLAIVIWMGVMAATGWYRDPELRHWYWVAIAVHAGVLGFVLYRSRATHAFGAQLGAGMTVSAAAAVLVFVGSLVLTARVFPSYFSELSAAQAAWLRDSQLPQPEIDEMLKRARAAQTPGAHAFASFMGTLATGLVLSLALAAALRQRTPRAGRRP